MNRVPTEERASQVADAVVEVEVEKAGGTHPAPPAGGPPLPGGDLYPAHLEIALSYEGVTELTGNNDGPEIKMFLAAVGLNEGYAYCAAFVSYCLDEVPARYPASTQIIRPDVRSALAYDFITDYSIEARKVVRGFAVPPGTILVWRKGDTIFGHIGFVTSWKGASGRTIEANTSPGAGSQYDGDGVYQRKRTIQPGNYFRITHFTKVVYAQGH